MSLETPDSPACMIHEDLYKSFAPAIQSAFHGAEGEAFRFNHASIISAHLLVGTMKGGRTSRAATVLYACGMSLIELRRAIEARFSPPFDSTDDKRPISDLLSKALESVNSGEKCGDRSLQVLLSHCLVNPAASARIVVATIGADPDAVAQRLTAEE